MNQLQNIYFGLPTKTVTQQLAFESLSILLVDGVSLRQKNQDFHFPKIGLQPIQAQWASVTFADNVEIKLDEKLFTKRLTNRNKLKLEEVCNKFRGHIIAVDHIGVNLSPAEFGGSEIEDLLRFMGATTNLYAYPNSEPWYFVIPSTLQEWNDKIYDFSEVRLPKFELVIDKEGTTPLIQIDFITDLIRTEVEKRLPDPFGIGIPGLSQYFRSVFVEHPWQGCEIRFDFRYATDILNEWSTGEWLVTTGKRYNHAIGWRQNRVHFWHYKQYTGFAPRILTLSIYAKGQSKYIKPE